MIKKFLTACAFVTSFGVNADCITPNNTINYLPVGTTPQFCFDKEIDKTIVGSGMDVMVELDKPEFKSIRLSSVNQGVFTNWIIYFSDGERKEFNLLTLPRLEVEKVIFMKE